MFEVLSGCNVIGHGLFGSMEISSTPPTNYDNIEMEGIGSVMLPNSLQAPIESFHLLGNSVQGENPTPENPQEIKSCGKSGKNLFDISQYGKYDDTWTNTTYATKKLQLKPNTTYTMSCKRLVDRPKQYVIFNIVSGIKTGKAISVQINPSLQLNYFTGKGTFTTGETGEIVLNYYVDCPKDQYWFTEVIGDIQIELGSAQTDYEPYTDKKLFDVKLTGRNLIDVDELRNENGKIDSVFTKARDISNFDVIKDRKYLLISKGTMLIDIRYSAIYFGKDDLKYLTNHNDILSTGTGYKLFTGKEMRIVLTAKETCTITKVIIHGNAEKTDAYIAEELGLFEISDNDINIDYETYRKPQTIQLQLDEPLRGIGEYKDVITKDGILRKILQVRIADYLQKDIYGKPGGRYIFSEVPNCYINYNRKQCMSNVGFTTNQENIAYMPVPYLDEFKLGVSDDDTVETIREKVKDVVVAYTVKEPILEPLENSLESLHTNDGTTIITVDSGEVETGIKLTYRKEK